MEIMEVWCFFKKNKKTSAPLLVVPKDRAILRSLERHEGVKIEFESGRPVRRSTLIFLSKFKFYPFGFLDEAIYVLIVYESNFFTTFLEHSQEGIIGEGW